MNLPLGFLFDKFDTFLLVFGRMAGLFVVAPIFGRRNVPSHLKVGLAFFLALILVSTVTPARPEYAESVLSLTAVTAREFILGMAMGYAAYLVFSAIYLAGQFIDMQIGFGVVNIIDPVSNIQVPFTANIYFLISMLLLLELGGHHLLISALRDSYRAIPLGEAVFKEGFTMSIVKVFAETFVLGFKIGAPVLAVMVVVDVALGVISRTLPQINIFVVGMPLKILLGVVLIFLTIPLFVGLVGDMVKDMNSAVLNIVESAKAK